MTIRMNETILSETNTNMWAEGFSGKIAFTDNGILIISDGSLDYVTIQAEFDNSLFSPIVTNDTNFESVLNDFSGDDTVFSLDRKVIFIGISILFFLMSLSRSGNSSSYHDTGSGFDSFDSGSDFDGGGNEGGVANSLNILVLIAVLWYWQK